MARSSHQACSVCRVRIHKRNRYGLCPQHYQEHELKLRIERAAARMRRASKVTNPIEIVIEDMAREKTGTEVKTESEARQNGAAPMPRTRRKWSDEVKLKVGEAYEDESIPIEDIMRRFEMGEGTLYRIVRGLGLPTRRSKPSDPPPPPEVVEELPAPQVAALERMLVPPAREPLATVPAPRARQAPVPSSLSMAWTVKVEGLITVEADDIAEALRIVKQGYPNLRISGINESG
jgi:transposase-like protein